MDYDKIIIELLSRIQVLEDKVAMLMNADTTKSEKKVTTDEIREYIIDLKTSAKSRGSKTLVLTARDIHGELELKHRYPMVCNAMRDCMQLGDTILFQPPKGNSSTLKIEYNL